MSGDAICAYVCRLVGIWLERRILTKPCDAITTLSVAKSNFPLRLVGRVLSADDAKVAAGQSGTGAEYLPGKGSFLYVDGSEVRRFQSYYIPDIQRQAGLVADGWLEQTPLPWVQVGELQGEDR